MAIFKPLSRQAKNELANTEDKNPFSKITADKLTERIDIIYDDSSSMNELVRGTTDSRIKLAADATEDFLKNCQPYITAVQISPLNTAPRSLTANLPSLAKEAKTLGAYGGTPLFEALGKAVDQHEQHKWTHIVIFTDGEAGDYKYFLDRPTLFKEAKELGIPIDMIIIGDKDESQLSADELEFKKLAEETKGTFLICTDGKAFKEKMKYFAPLLRHLLPSIASKES